MPEQEKDGLAARGALGGSNLTAGDLFESSVAAYVAAHILRRQPFADLELPSEGSVPISIHLQADVPVDDLVVKLPEGTAYLQAKRRLDFTRHPDKSIASVADQWIRLIRSRDFDPSRDRLVAAAGSATGPVHALGRALSRRRQPIKGAPTRSEHDALARLEALLETLTDNERAAVLDGAVIWIADVDADTALSARLGQALLEPAIVAAGHGLRAWDHLILHALKLSRQRYGADLDQLMRSLRERGVQLVADGKGLAAARAQQRHTAVAAYRARVRHRGEQIDFSGLGVPLPPLSTRQLAAADPDVAVLAPNESGRSSRLRRAPLPWALRRCGRALLLGPPGGGKSVALRATAAAYAERDDWPLPLVASLDRVAERLAAQGFVEALLEVAFEHEPPADRALLRAAAIEALVAGRAALFLDALDEAQELRGQVVRGLRTALAHEHEDVEVLLITRDTAYAEAHTLGFADFRLSPPWVSSDHLLELCFPDKPREWIEVRDAWVDRAIAETPDVRSTPLMIVLLTLLAAQHDEADLPRNRARALRLLLDDVVERWETGARLQHKTPVAGALEGRDAVRAMIEAAPLIAGAVMEQVRPLQTDVAARVAAGLVSRFGLAPGKAESAADAIIELWDQAGVFVADGRPPRMRAGLRVFAELGVAVGVASLPPEQQRRWTRHAANDPELREPVVLAAGLSAPVADALAEIARDELPATAMLPLVMHALEEGAFDGSASLAELACGIVEQMPPGHVEAAGALIGMPVEATHQAQALQWLDGLGEPHRTFARARAVHTWSRTDPLADEDLRSLLWSTGADLDGIDAWLGHPGQTLRFAVERLVRPRRRDIAAALERGFIDEDLGRFVAVSAAISELEHAGHIDVAERLRHALLIDEEPPPLTAEDHPEWNVLSMGQLLEQIGSMAAPAPLAYGDRRRLDALADLLSSAGVPPDGVWLEHFGQDVELLADALRAAIALAGLDPARIAAEALELLSMARAEQARGEKTGSYFGEDYVTSVMLGIGGRELAFDRWEQLADPAAARRALIAALLGSPYPFNQLAASCLRTTPASMRVATLDALPTLEDLPAAEPEEHATRMRCLAIVLVELAADDEVLERWAHDRRPIVLCAVADRALRLQRAADRRDVLARLLTSDDVAVRESAIRATDEAGLSEELRDARAAAASHRL